MRSIRKRCYGYKRSNRVAFQRQQLELTPLDKSGDCRAFKFVGTDQYYLWGKQIRESKVYIWCFQKQLPLTYWQIKQPKDSLNVGNNLNHKKQDLNESTDSMQEHLNPLQIG